MLQPGDRIGRYEIQRRLGRGGMGTVYVAHDPVLGRLVAIKLFAGDLDAADAATKFAREARAAAALNHPNIVTVHDFGEFESQPFIVMEYIQGETVARLIRKKTELPLSDRLRIIEELCAGVAYAHGFEVIHRDIKPANLMLDRANHLKILDFGIARILGTSMSRATAMIGTPGYMAPEQIRGGVTDRRSDLFSIGVVAYELLSYSEAFPGESVPAITHKILGEEPVPLSELVADIPAGLVTVIDRALSKDPGGRYPDAASMGTAIAEMRREVDGDPRYTTLVRTRPYPDATERGTRDSSAKQSSGTGPTTPVDPTGRREDLIRRRTEKIALALARACGLLQEGRLSDAHEACLEALTLDETHAGALQLELDISAAIAQQRVRDLIAACRESLSRGAVVEAEDTLRQIRELDARSPDARVLEKELRARRNEQAVAAEIAESLRLALDSATAALARGDADGAWTAARRALLLAPDSAEAKRLEAEAQRRIDADAEMAATVVVGSAPVTVAPTIIAPTVLAPGNQALDRPLAPDLRPAVAPAPQRPVKPHDATLWKVARQRTVSAVDAISSAASAVTISAKQLAARFARLPQVTGKSAPAPSQREPRVKRPVFAHAAVWIVVAVAAVGIGASAFAFLMTSPESPSTAYGTVSIDAVPWGRVTSIVGGDGAVHPLPDDPTTPLVIRLPVGAYRIAVAGPSASDARETAVTITEGKESLVDAGHFPTLTAEQYFEPYLLTAPQNIGEERVATVGTGAPELEETR